MCASHKRLVIQSILKKIRLVCTFPGNLHISKAKKKHLTGSLELALCVISELVSIEYIVRFTSISSVVAIDLVMQQLTSN